MRRILGPLFVALFCICGNSVLAQSPNGSINGIVFDPDTKSIPGAEIIAVNDLTGVKYVSSTNGEGIYTLANLPPGPYRLQVSKEGFKTIIKPDLILSVQDALSINFTLPIGASSVTVTVEGGAPLVNTTDAAVSTVVDRRFVDNMPLNGRSFQTLIMLTPGVVATPANPSNLGQFSVNGQRSDSNYFTVDGVSANVGIAGGNGLQQSAGGAVPAFSALGGTNSLVSVDAMQEFRIQTSSFAPEFGRTPGGQISIVTRSGTDQFHGTLFDYFRNDALDASNWFADRSGLPKPQDRQNDFGGVFGGRLLKDRTFFFFSYEGLRLRQPLSAQTIVPDIASRQQAPAAVQPYLNAFPVPNGTLLSAGRAEFNGSYSNPAMVNAVSIRLDHIINSRLALFARYNYSPSEVTQRVTTALSSLATSSFMTHTLTLGLTASLSSKVSNEMRGNYSNVKSGLSLRLDSFGGAKPLTDSVLFPTGFSSKNSLFALVILSAGTSSSGSAALLAGKTAKNEQRQASFLDNLSVTVGVHQLKFGVDYRWLSPISGSPAYEQSLVFSGVAGPSGFAVSGTALLAATSAVQNVTLLSQNLSLYGQDTWKIGPRFTLTYGLRWDVNPPLRGKDSQSQLFTVTNLADPTNLGLAPRGTHLYGTTYRNFAPRAGAAYRLREKQGRESVLRGGFGIFYDLGSGTLGQLTYDWPFQASKFMFFVPLPLSSQQAAPPPLNQNLPITAPGMLVADPNLKLPRTYQWNLAIEQALGKDQTISATYIGAVGLNLLRQDTLNSPNSNFPTPIYVTRNTGRSDYNALQLKFQRRLSRRLQALASYTWSHSIDNTSSDSVNFNTPGTVGDPNIDRGSSDFDVRNLATGALTYDVPFPYTSKASRAILSGWSLDNLFIVESSLPVDILGPVFIVAGTQFQSRANVVPGMPLYLFGPQYPGGKALNPAAFTSPPSGQQGNLGRNVVRGFGAWQADFTIRRQFHLTERIGLQFRTELFNIFNHPNFGPPTNSLSSPTFGLSTQTLASSLGTGGASGGFNPLYQIGGPRSIQLALKLQF